MVVCLSAQPFADVHIHHMSYAMKIEIEIARLYLVKHYLITQFPCITIKRIRKYQITRTRMRRWPGALPVPIAPIIQLWCQQDWFGYVSGGTLMISPGWNGRIYVVILQGQYVLRLV